MEVYIILGFCILGGIALLLDTFFIVNTQNAYIIERLGKFKRIAGEGLNLKLPLLDRIVARRSLRIHQLDVDVETKTKDNVFVKTKVSVQYQIIRAQVDDSYYSLTNPIEQIESYVFDVVRSEIPKMNLDNVFLNKDSLALAINDNLSESMGVFGFQIIKSLVTDIDPDTKVKFSMNEINAAERMREAELAKAEAKKITIVKEAEAHAEGKRLQGEGLANQRKAIATGLKESIEDLRQTGIDNDEVMTLLLITQHYDSIEAVSRNSESNTIMLPYTASAVNNIRQQMQEAILSTQEIRAKSSLSKDSDPLAQLSKIQ